VLLPYPHGDEQKAHPHCTTSFANDVVNSPHMTSMTIYLGADHAGFALKEKVKAHLLDEGFEIYDLSPTFRDGDDYPLPAHSVATHVSKDKGSRGVLVCGSGVGVTIGANRVKNIRAFDAFDETTVKFAREHNDANVIALSGWHTPATKAKKFLATFFKTKFSSSSRHHRRVKQLG
jgi:ribose 5-phosphate isomerase B